MDKFGGRKTTMGLLFLILSTGMAYLLGDLPPHLQDMLKYLWVAFVAGNGVEHVAGAMKKPATRNASTSSTAVTDTLGKLLGYAEANLESTNGVKTALTSILDAEKKALEAQKASLK